jgi:hypothetical protein
VVAEYYDFFGSRKNYDKIIDILPRLNDSSLFFCKSPNSAMDLAKFMAERVPENQTEIVSEFCNWIAKNYHTEWILIDILKHGIGVHHARIPRAVANFILYLFNKKHIKYLVCTSTLIEGVNTVAKNVVLYDNRINTRKIDYFTFNNIVGRSGRMFEHFIGNVYLLQPPPEKELPIVDLPIYSQDENTAKSLLLNVDESDLKESSRLKMKAIYENGIISLTTLRKNMGVDPELQIEFAKDLNTNYLSWHPFLYWSRKPSYDQLKFICNKIWNSFNGSNLGSGSVISSEQLTYMIFNLKGKFKESLDAYLRPTYNIDKAISKVLDFRKLWAGFHFPRLLITINNIQEEIYTKRGMPCGSYAFYAKEIENYCLPANMIALEEYGLPAEISMTLRSLVNFDGTFEEVISRMKKIDANRLRNDRIERFIFKLFQKYI